MIDATTKLWFRNDSDERAAANGCRFDVLRGSWTVFWMERYCLLYEGEGYAGQPLILHGCQDCDHSDFYAMQEFDEARATERAELFAECVANGHRIDWQYDFFMRLCGWVHHSERWGREVRRFRESELYIAKKNKKSPSLAAFGLYLTIGDGEPGNNVYLAAKDGAQSREIAAKHTIEMYLQSEELQAECSLNRSLMQITHEASRSRLKPLSSANARTQESKEGLNGSILIDEEHVVDRAFVDRISRAGISRSEPLMCAFSTTGNNPDSYGKERFDYSLDVAAGRKVDEQLLSAIYAAPQDLTDEQLEADFDRYARMANPSLGHTIDPVELRQDYEKSKAKRLEEFLLFKMYRLNIWQHSANPWLRPSDWAKCAAKYTAADLSDVCFGGLDLALDDDTCAFLMLFPNGKKNDQPCFRLWVHFFLPMETAKNTSSKIPWLDWEKSGHITLTPGNRTDFPLVRRTIREAAKRLSLAAVGYDPRYAATLAQDLQDEDGVNMVEYGQSAANFVEPMGLVENDISEGRLEHPGNKCLDWQARNATKHRSGRLTKPDDGKTAEDRLKKIDGITALVMARAMAAEHVETGPLFYYR